MAIVSFLGALVLCQGLCFMDFSSGVEIKDEFVAKPPVEFPAFCLLTEGRKLKTFNGKSEELSNVAGESFINLCLDPSQFSVTVTISGNHSAGSATLYLTVRDGSRVVQVTIKQRENFKYNSYNTGGFDCNSMAGVQTVVRNFGETLVIETGFVSIIVNRDLKVEGYMVQNPRSPLCGICGRLDDMTTVCSKRTAAPLDQRVETTQTKEAAEGSALNWSYDEQSDRGQLKWYQLTPANEACDVNRPFMRQSPINIDTNTVVLDPNASLPFYNVKEEQTTSTCTLINAGHAPVLTFASSPVILYKIPFSWDQFELHDLQFHFGRNDRSGSEHKLNGEFYAGEIQFVHFNTIYGTFHEAMKHHDGLVIVAAFLEVSRPDVKSELSHLLSFLPNITHKGMAVDLPVNMSGILPSEMDLSDYFTYDGSLTTPGCQEIVRWMVLSKPWGISQDQLRVLRLLRTDRDGSEPMGIHGNCRPVVPNNNRIVISRKN